MSQCARRPASFGSGVAPTGHALKYERRPARPGKEHSMSETKYSDVIGASSNASYMDPPPSIESVVNAHDAAEGDPYRVVDRRGSGSASPREKAAVQIRRVGHALDAVGRALKKRDQGRAAKYADGIVAGIERLATYVDSTGPAAPASKRRPQPGSLSHRARFVGLVAKRVLKRVRATARRADEAANDASLQPPRTSGTGPS
jgi:hypothetical protein